jgi:TolA-binding protein
MMQKTRIIRNRLVAAAFALLLVAAPMPACAASKEIIELQTQVQQLVDMVQRLQSTMDARFGVVQHLAEQTADSANQMTAAVTTLQQKIAAQNDAVSGKLDTASGQVQALNDSVDELKSRIAKLDKSIQDLQTQLQNIQNPPTSVPAPTPASPSPSPPPPAPAGNGATPVASSPVAAPTQPESQAPPLAETFQAGVRDYNAARYEVATGEFQDVIHYYPLDELSGTYNAVLEGFPGNAKAPAAQLRKGLALLQMNRKDAGVHELRLLIQRHPMTPEAAQARTKLNGMGIKPSAAK